MMHQIKAFLLLLALVLGDAACHEEGLECSLNEDTFNMRADWHASALHHRICHVDVDLTANSCRDRAKNWEEEQECFEQQSVSWRYCQFFHAQKANVQPLRVCGTTIFLISGDPEDESFRVEPNMEDADGDGIADYWEWRMGMNPCTTFSLGECSIPDSDQDWDADNKPNGEDHYPICADLEDPQDAPPGSLGDCV